MPKVAKGKLINRNDTSDNWRDKNPILIKGELGVENDTGKFKFGDGVNHWNDLKYSGNEAKYIEDIHTSNLFEIWIGTQDEYLEIEDEPNIMYIIK